MTGLHLTGAMAMPLPGRATSALSAKATTALVGSSGSLRSRKPKQSASEPLVSATPMSVLDAHAREDGMVSHQDGLHSGTSWAKPAPTHPASGTSWGMSSTAATADAWAKPPTAGAVHPPGPSPLPAPIEATATGQANASSDDAAIITDSLQVPEAFAQVFDRHAGAVHGYLLRRIGPDDADEMLSEVFLQAFKNRHRFISQSTSARPWLFGIATNVIRHHYRSETRRYNLVAKAAHTETALHHYDPMDAIAGAVDASRQNPALAAILAKLSKGDRDVLLLFAWGDLSYAEIAESLSIPVGTVRSRLSRTRALVKNALNHDASAPRDAQDQGQEGGGRHV